MKRIILLFIYLSALTTNAATFTVTTNADIGIGSLRQAILDANALPGYDVIDFTGSFSITLSSPLPNITSPVLVNGLYTTGPQIELNGTTNAIAGIGLLIAASAPGTTIKGLNIHGHTGQGILVAASDVAVIGCYIGTDITGMIDRGNGASGIEVAAFLTNITIGGSTPDSSNLVSGNAAVGINIAPGGTNIRVAGNRVGVNRTGNAILKNDQIGVLINGATNLIVGGSFVGEENCISGNDQIGLSMISCTNVLVARNNIGIGANGTTAIGNGGHGIMMSLCSNVQLGGGFGFKNTISSNNANGIEINDCNGLTIQYNFIGTDQFGLLQRPNQSHGIQLNGTNTGTIIGGSRHVTGNIISSNRGAGINFQDPGNGKALSSGTIVKGNLIGTDSTTTQDFGNFVIGIILKSDNCIIGGTTNDEGNVIAGTDLFCGLLIANGNNNIVSGNYIGVGLNGTTPIPNTQDGINISVENAGQTASNNFILNNVIAYNLRHGVNVGLALNNFINNSEVGNRIRFNQIYCNVNKGIFLNLTAPADRGNNGNEAPIIDNVNSTANIVAGFTSALQANEKIDLYLVVDCPTCDINPQGKIWIDSTQANGSGAWSYDYFAEFGTTIPGNIIATATDALGNTSEFSICCRALSGTTLTPSANPVCQGTTFSITYSNGQAGDSLMLQQSLDGTTWTNVSAKLLADPILYTNLVISDTTQFRFITFTTGSFAVAACKDTSISLTVNYVPLPIAGTIAFTSNASICEGGTFALTLTGSSGTIQWQKSIDNGSFTNISGATGTTFSEPTSSPVTTIQYQVEVGNPTCGTVFTNSLTGTVINLNPGTISGPIATCGITTTTLTLSGQSGTIEWQDSTSTTSWTTIAAATSSIDYTASSEVAIDYVRVIISDASGLCPSEVSEVYRVVSDTCSDPLPILIANALTKNGDGSNDTFYIKNIETYPNSHIIIYNRWGNKVYEATGYLNTWDGEDLPEATYYYLLELGEDRNGNQNSQNKYQGSITVLK